MSDKLEDLMAQRATVITEATAIHDAVGEEGLKAEQRDSLRASMEKLTELDTAIAQAQGDEELSESLRAAKDTEEKVQAALRASARKPVHATAPVDEPKAALRTLGEQFTESDAYKEWMQKFPEGGPSKGAFQGDSVNVGSAMRRAMGLRTPTERSLRTLITSADTSAGDLVQPDFRGLLEPGLVAPLSIRDLLTVIPTTSDAIQWVRETSRTSNATSVPEAGILGDASGTKPQGGLVFDIATTPIVTIAEWVPATTRILADASGLAAYINAYLLSDLAHEVEDQVINGAGAPDFDGILGAGIQTNAVAGPLATSLYALRDAKRLIAVNGRTNATAIVLNPEDMQAIDLEVINAEVNHFIGGGPYQPGQRTIWGIPAVESEAVPQGTALTGDFSKAVLWTREEATVSVGTANDDFIRNIVRVLAELRSALTVLRPNAFVATTL